MSNKYKLTYFNVRGIVEPVRFLFAYLEIPYENLEIDFKQWDSAKKEFKWGKLPSLEYNGKILTQSTAILNFLAEKHNLVPEDPWNRAKYDEIIGAVHDLRQDIRPIIMSKFGGDTDKIKQLQEELMSSKVPTFLQNMNELLKEIREAENTKSDFIFGGEKPVAVDFFLAHFLEQWSDLLDEPNLLEKYELLKKQQEATFNLPQVAKWIANRPPSFI